MLMKFHVYVCMYVFVGRKVWNSAIHGLRVSKGAKYKFANNPCIALRVQITDHLVCLQVQSKDKLQVSGVALIS